MYDETAGREGGGAGCIRVSRAPTGQPSGVPEREALRRGRVRRHTQLAPPPTDFLLLGIGGTWLAPDPTHALLERSLEPGL